MTLNELEKTILR